MRISVAYEKLTKEERSLLVQALANKMNQLRLKSSPSKEGEALYPGLNIPREDIKAMEDGLARLVKIGKFQI